MKLKKVNASGLARLPFAMRWSRKTLFMFQAHWAQNQIQWNL